MFRRRRVEPHNRQGFGARLRRGGAGWKTQEPELRGAHKLARLIYTLLTKGTAYVDQGQAYYEERHRQRVLHHLHRKAAAMGFKLTPTESIPA